MPEIFRNYFWAGMAVWAALYISDYYLTLTCARLYQGGVKEKIKFEGSYEITPQFQSDIDNLRKISPRFVRAMICGLALLFLIWLTSRRVAPEAYGLALGTLIGIQLAIHMRHFRNLAMFRALAAGELDGQIEYPRPLMLRFSAFEMLAFVGLFLVLYLFTSSWFVLGCALGCLMLAAKHSQWSQKAAADKVASAGQEETTT